MVALQLQISGFCHRYIRVQAILGDTTTTMFGPLQHQRNISAPSLSEDNIPLK